MDAIVSVEIIGEETEIRLACSSNVSVTEYSGPIKHSKLVTQASLIGSIGGLVTWVSEKEEKKTESGRNPFC